MKKSLLILGLTLGLSTGYVFAEDAAPEGVDASSSASGQAVDPELIGRGQTVTPVTTDGGAEPAVIDPVNGSVQEDASSNTPENN